MKRREFIQKSGCSFACFTAAGIGLNLPDDKSENLQARRRYKFDIEIYETSENATCYRKGQKFEYPADKGKICHWFLASMQEFLLLMQYGVTLPWKFEGTPYEKVIDPDGVTTEFIRCPDPVTKIVAKVTRTRI